MLIPHPKQKEIIRSKARWKTIRAGRKGGKSILEVEVIAFKATASISRLKLTKDTFPTGRKVIYIAPTIEQARSIVWEALKTRLHGVQVSVNESRLQMRVNNEDGGETTIYVGGWENRENYRGFTDVIHITFDEVDTLRDFFVAWREIFRPMFLDTGGTADFIGTPKKENPNLRRLEKEAENDPKTACFHFTSKDNPHLSRDELEELERDYRDDRTAYQQEVLAEYVDDTAALFHYDALVDVFSNTVEKKSPDDKYLIVDVADDGSDKVKFSFWHSLEEYRRETFERLNTEGIVQQIREYCQQERIPMSHVAVDAIGVGAGVASHSLLDGIVGFKSSYGPIKTDDSIVNLPNVRKLNNPMVPKFSEYRNLRSQCVFILASLVNNHSIASRVTGRLKEAIIEELSTYQDVSKGDGKLMATQKEDIKEHIGRSPDDSDTWVMRMYFILREKVVPHSSEEQARVAEEQRRRMAVNRAALPSNK